MYLSFRSSNGARPNGTRLIEAGENLGDAAMGDEKLPGDVARPDA